MPSSSLQVHLALVLQGQALVTSLSRRPGSGEMTEHLYMSGFMRSMFLEFLIDFICTCTSALYMLSTRITTFSAWYGPVSSLSLRAGRRREVGPDAHGVRSHISVILVKGIP
eukprot:6239078-Amphidinium_carterae.1